jgi:phosphoenolpyruvate synthase/pyruvate phosphate dikinase
MSQARIVWLDARADIDEKAVGPKALSLVRLSRIGLPVPAGFCIPVEAYREHVETHGMARQAASALDALASASAEQKRSILSEIRESIIQAPPGRKDRRRSRHITAGWEQS